MHVVKAKQEGNQRGLSCAGVADDGDGFAGFERERDIAQNPVPLFAFILRRMRVRLAGWLNHGVLPRLVAVFRHATISEPDVIELDSAGTLGFLGDRRRKYLSRSIEQFKDPLRRGHRGLQNVVFLAEVLDGTEKTLSVLHEGDEYAKRSSHGDDVKFRISQQKPRLCVVLRSDARLRMEYRL